MNEPQLGLDLYPTDYELIKELSSIYDQQFLADYLNKQPNSNWTRETINRWLKGKAAPKLSKLEYDYLEELLPKPKVSLEDCDFTFIDLFAGIGGIRKGFEEQNGYCVFSSEWDKFARRTYKANFACDHAFHTFNEDIRDITLSMDSSISEEEAYKHIDINVPNHDILLAGFPCQPFSLAGVSKKNSLGAKHGFECSTQGTLFFDVARIIAAKKPIAFVLENVKNLKSHDRGKTFKVIIETLTELGYEVADAEHTGPNDPKIINGSHWVPQNRERIVLIGFRKDLNIHNGFSLKDLPKPTTSPVLGDILEDADKVDDKYILTPNLWKYLFNYAEKHRAKGNGFGYGLVGPDERARTLSARYHKDGSEILIDRGWDFSKDFENEANMAKRPRRLTPLECSRLMGLSSPQGSEFKIPVSDTQAYKQFGNSVVSPMFSAIAKFIKPRIMQVKKQNTMAKSA
ncbi:DNA-cytosine methyltransferase [Oligella ureolytica]|uniref:Cytosine-specific methyltransferase n=1 Tax=Oligella ureolytica TaxID=90244 RepID=A0A378XIC2_9BURK|nr:DNA (cytosine-5-)-methyltransferase [Oligella ureolytica]QPT39410.1 DNA (cytosine-5-)-methyltransferase [Oligella ureolytica]SUA56058.1 DNA-cytosine methyltransferase [Oligella ureolytica]SUA57392.1 DNA-cytosine methyltransferase [Oligella ureolytica]